MSFKQINIEHILVQKTGIWFIENVLQYKSAFWHDIKLSIHTHYTVDLDLTSGEWCSCVVFNELFLVGCGKMCNEKLFESSCNFFILNCIMGIQTVLIWVWKITVYLICTHLLYYIVCWYLLLFYTKYKQVNMVFKCSCMYFPRGDNVIFKYVIFLFFLIT